MKTKIEWIDYTLNPVKGLCPMGCSYCYARRMYKRFKWDAEIRYEDTFWHGIPGKAGDKYFIGSTMELFGDWIEDWWIENILQWIKCYPQRTFIFLTKAPSYERLIKWEFPDNCWVGLTVTHEGVGEGNYGCSGAITALEDVKAPVKFISFEPLLSKIETRFVDFVDWVIIGQQTPIKNCTRPHLEWVREIVEDCDTSNIPVFLKNNLFDVFVHNQCSMMLPQWALNKREGYLRQEFPRKWGINERD
jgi:protein gp37